MNYGSLNNHAGRLKNGGENMALLSFPLFFIFQLIGIKLPILFDTEH